MMITWQFENAFQNLGEYSKASIFPGFEEQQSGDQSSLRYFVGGGGEAKETCFGGYLSQRRFS